MDLDEIAAATGGRGDRALRRCRRRHRHAQIQPGDLFVALRGVRDGHDFVAQAMDAGAAGALVSRPSRGRGDGRDTLRALERLGRAARDRSPARRCAVTGSVGKTSVTQAIAAACARAGRATAR